MRILVTGGGGQLARALEAAAPHEVLRVGRPAFDFDRPDSLVPVLHAVVPPPAVVVNAAAYTAVDRAESEPAAAARANRDGPAVLARWCAEAGVPLIHISTDYVFDGLKGAPYVETDRTSPTGVYGATKLAGERMVLDLCPQAIVLRTSWVYAATGRNFVLTMLAAGRRTGRLRVVADQIGCPTAAPDLAQAILAVAARFAASGWNKEWRGIYHAAGTGSTSWHGLACAIFDEVAPRGYARPEVAAITTAEWPTPVRRPPDSRLDCGKLERTFGVRLPDWRESLSRVLDRVEV